MGPNDYEFSGRYSRLENCVGLNDCCRGVRLASEMI